MHLHSDDFVKSLTSSIEKSAQIALIYQRKQTRSRGNRSRHTTQGEMEALLNSGSNVEFCESTTVHIPYRLARKRFEVVSVRAKHLAS